MNTKQYIKISFNGDRLHFKSRYVFLIAFIIYRVTLDICYFQVINKNYDYMGFVDKRNWGLFILSWIVFFVYFIALDDILEDEEISITNIMIYSWSLLNFVPFTSLIYSGAISSQFIIYNFIYTMILIISVHLFNHIDFGTIKLGMKNSYLDLIITIIGIASVAIVLYISYRYTGFRLNFNLEYVYDLRLEARTYNMSSIMQYLFSWTKVIDNILLAYCLINKRWGSAVVFFIAQLISFGIDGSKSAFFMTFLVIAISFFGAGAYIQIKKIAAWGMAGLTAVSFIEPLILDSNYLATYIVRRVMYIPVYLGDLYVDYFTTHTPDYFRSSFLRLFGFASPYTSRGGISRVIGLEYFNSSTMSANSGMISDAMANLGIVGIFVMPILLVIILKLMDMCASNMDNRIFLVVAVYFALSLTNSFLFTVLLTHGMLIATIIFLLISSQKRKSVKT